MRLAAELNVAAVFFPTHLLTADHCPTDALAKHLQRLKYLVLHASGQIAAELQTEAMLNCSVAMSRLQCDLAVGWTRTYL